jgi:hypothetical protein
VAFTASMAMTARELVTAVSLSVERAIAAEVK